MVGLIPLPSSSSPQQWWRVHWDRFQERLQELGIKDVPTTIKNPQANASCERIHQTVANSLCTMVHTNPPQNQQYASKIVDMFLTIAMHGVRAAVHRNLNTSPGGLVFH